MGYYDEAAALSAKAVVKLNETSGSFLDTTATHTWTVANGTPTRSVALLGDVVGITAAGTVRLQCSEAGLATFLGTSGTTWSVSWVGSCTGTTGFQAWMDASSGATRGIYARNSSHLIETFGWLGTVLSGGQINDGTVRHFVLVSDAANSRARLYVDGFLMVETATPAAFVSADDLAICSDTGALASALQGSIGGIVTFTTALTDANVRTLWNQLRPGASNGKTAAIMTNVKSRQGVYDMVRAAGIAGFDTQRLLNTAAELTAGVDLIVIPDDLTSPLPAAGTYKGDTIPILFNENSLWVDRGWTSGVTSINGGTALDYVNDAKVVWAGQTPAPKVNIPIEVTGAGAPWLYYGDLPLPLGAHVVATHTGFQATRPIAIVYGENDQLFGRRQVKRAAILGNYGLTFMTPAGRQLAAAMMTWLAATPGTPAAQLNAMGPYSVTAPPPPPYRLNAMVPVAITTVPAVAFLQLNAGLAYAVMEYSDPVAAALGGMIPFVVVDLTAAGGSGWVVVGRYVDASEVNVAGAPPWVTMTGHQSYRHG